MDDPEQGVAEDAWRECFHDALVVYGPLFPSGGEGLAVRGPVFGHIILAQLVDCTLVDDAVGGHCRAGDFGQRGFWQAEGVLMLNIGGVQCHEDGETLLGTLVVSSSLCQLLIQVDGHLAIAIILEWVGGPVA
jgi:hypothetical protein